MLKSIFILFTSLSCHAGPFTGEIHRKDDGKTNFESIAKIVYSSYKYEEPGVMTISGPMTGFDLTTTYVPVARSHYFGGNLNYMSGDGTYRGSISDFQSGESLPWSESDKTLINTARIFIGKNFIKDDITGYFIATTVGLSYRYLNNQGTSQYSYEREQTYWYFPLSLELTKPLNNFWTIRGGMELDLFISGHNKSHVAEFNNPEFAQKSGGGSKYSIALIRHLEESDFVADIFYQTWNIAQSEPVSTGLLDNDGNSLSLIEPRNSTKVLGLGAGLTF